MSVIEITVCGMRRLNAAVVSKQIICECGNGELIIRCLQNG